MGLDKRIGSRFLGSIFPRTFILFSKRYLAIITTADKFKTNFSTIKSVIKSNENRSKLLLNRVHYLLKNKIKNKNIFLVTFKKNTDDMRNSFSLSMIPYFFKKGSLIKYYD